MDSGTSRGISSSTRRKVSILLETLRKDPNFELFIHPIDPVRDGCLDYFEVIKTPMDLMTVSNKLLNDQYKNINEMYQDVVLIFSNCREYNTSPLCSHIIELCNRSENRFLVEWNKLGFSDQSTKKRLEELSLKLNKGQKPAGGRGHGQSQSQSQSQNQSQNQGVSADQSANNSSQQKPSSRSRARNTSNSARGASNKVVLKIDKEGTPSNNCDINSNNKRQKAESSKKSASGIPLKKRRENDKAEPSPVIKNSSPVHPGKASSDLEQDSNSDWKSECLRILNLLRKEHNSFLFEHPVLESNDLTEETKSRYREVISETSDYITIENSLVSNPRPKKGSSNSKKRSASSKTYTCIENPHEFERLVKLVFSNCMTFNPNSGDCKWIYDSAKQSLNKFNSLWGKSNVFLMYSNHSSTPNTIDIKDHQSDTSIGFSISTTHHRQIGSSLTNPSVPYQGHLMRSKLHSHSRSPASSFNKIITQWNNFSIIWRQFILNKHLHTKPSPVSPKSPTRQPPKRSLRSNRGNPASQKLSFKIPQTTENCSNKSHSQQPLIRDLFDHQHATHENPECFEGTFNSKSNPQSTPVSSYHEYIFPLKIYNSNTVHSSSDLTNLIDQFGHYMNLQVPNYSEISIYCFNLPKSQDPANIPNSISNHYYLAHTNHPDLMHKYIELKISIPNSLSQISVSSLIALSRVICTP
ncbi:bromo domain-containing protein [Cryptosporidium canis]|nr:bromo domain-containing protein [Cryptosporidium canis]